MAADTQLKKVFTRGDPLLVFKWVVEDVPFGHQFGVDHTFIETIELTFNNIKSEGVFNGGGFTYFPGFHDVSAFNVTFYGDVKGRTLKYLMYWKSQIKDFKTGLYNLPYQYKRDWRVALLTPSGDVAFRVELQGCWPADTSQIQLDYNDGSSRVSFNQNFSVDNSVVIV